MAEFPDFICCNKVIGIIVTFNPHPAYLTALFSSLGEQCFKVVVVDNSETVQDTITPNIANSGFGTNKFQLIRLGENAGIAKALNVGIQWALDQGADFVILSDQDSLPARDMLENLLRAYTELTGIGVQVGALGPTVTDLHRPLTLPFQVQLPGRFFYGHRQSLDDDPHVDALGLITSGTLIPAAVIGKVGLMREEYFIDKVDHEWCHRARAQGYRLFGTGWAHMYQRFGESGLRVWYFGWRDESVYSPLRVYYQLRNYVAICRLGYVDWKWKARAGWYSLGVFYSQVLFGKTRLQSFKMGLLGLWHGIMNKMGKYA